MLLEAQARARLPNPARDFVEDVTEEDVLGLLRHDAEYRVDSTGARVSISSAKSLLFQYCSKLPSDWWATSLPDTIIRNGSAGRDVPCPQHRLNFYQTAQTAADLHVFHAAHCACSRLLASQFIRPILRATIGWANSSILETSTMGIQVQTVKQILRSYPKRNIIRGQCVSFIM